MSTNNIGLDSNESKETAVMLNELMANYVVFYQNSKGFHWNVKGKEFFTLHIKFEELYNDLFAKIDELAERVLALGAKPNYRFSELINVSKIKESNEDSDGIRMVEEVLNAFQVLLTMQRDILDKTSAIGDEGTSAMMSDYIREQEKLVWMYSAFLG